MNRLFFAIFPNAQEREAAERAAREVKIKQPPIGPQLPAETFHVTLIFLGDLTDAQEAAARRAAREVALDPFAITFDHAACFNNREVPWWLGSRAPTPAATELRDELHRMLQGASVPLPKRANFVPHITLYRHQRTNLAPTPVTSFVWTVNEFVLVRSQLQPMRYDIIERFSLKGRKAAPMPASKPDQLSLL